MFRRNILSLAQPLLLKLGLHHDEDCAEERKRIEELERQLRELQDKQEQEQEQEQKRDRPELETTRVDKEFVEEALSDLDGWGLRHSYWYDDNKYNLPDRDGFGRAVLRDEISEREYIEDIFDCDNYSDHIVALFSTQYTCNAVGTILSQDGDPHAFNVVVFPDGEAELFEPGSGGLAQGFVTGSDLDRYSLNGALIRI